VRRYVASRRRRADRVDDTGYDGATPRQGVYLDGAPRGGESARAHGRRRRPDHSRLCRPQAGRTHPCRAPAGACRLAEQKLNPPRAMSIASIGLPAITPSDSGTRDARVDADASATPFAEALAAAMAQHAEAPNPKAPT